MSPASSSSFSGPPPFLLFSSIPAAVSHPSIWFVQQVPSFLLPSFLPAAVNHPSISFVYQASTPTLTSSPQPSLEGAQSQDDSRAPSWILLSNQGSAVFPRPGGGHQGVCLKYDQSCSGLELCLGLDLRAQCFCHEGPTTMGQYVNDTFLLGSLVPERSASSSC